MALENLTDQIKERAAEVWGKIQESPTFNNLRERFETLSPPAQRGIVAGAVVVVALILLSFPYSDLSNSGAQEEDFNANRSLLRQLLRASRLASEGAGGAAPVSGDLLKSMVQNQLGLFALQPEQIIGVNDIDGRAAAGALAASTNGVQVSGVGVVLKDLNLKQIVDIGFELQRLNPAVKMAGLEVKASAADNHYFDVVYKLVAFSMPESAAPPSDNDDAATPGGGRRSPPRGGGVPPGEEAPDAAESEVE